VGVRWGLAGLEIWKTPVERPSPALATANPCTPSRGLSLWGGRSTPPQQSPNSPQSTLMRVPSNLPYSPQEKWTLLGLRKQAF